MSLFLSTLLPKKETRVPRRVRKRLFQRQNPRCCSCYKPLKPGQRTIEHVIPYIILRASWFSIKPRYEISCRRCNSSDTIPSMLGCLWVSQDIKQIQFAARALCDLVRKKKCGIV